MNLTGQLGNAISHRTLEGLLAIGANDLPLLDGGISIAE
jgi:hypothetical protein